MSRHGVQWRRGVAGPTAVAVMLAGAWWSTLGAPSAPAAGTIVAEQQAVVSADHRPVVDAAVRALAGGQGALDAARSRQAADVVLAAQAATLAGRAAAAVRTDTGDLARDTASRHAASGAIADDLGRLRAVGIELYVGPEITPVDGPDGLADVQREEFATDIIDIGAASLITDLHGRRSDLRVATQAVAVDDRRLAGDRDTLARSTALRDHRTALLAQDRSAILDATATVATDRTTLLAAEAARAQAVAALANPAGAPDDGTPSIEGVSALDAAQLVTWYGDEGWGDLTTAPIQQLAGWYLSEGRAEGIRGDVAFAQAMVETAGFSSNDAVTLDNFAGIGHCDTCRSGLAFASPLLGVRGQIQLLHSFADGSLTAAQLAMPLAVASLTPQAQPDRGCCATWQSLTGRWATDPLYGRTIMAVYGRMLSDALAHSGP